MKKIISLLLLSSLVAVVTSAHEFWLYPATWFVQPGQPVAVRLCVGEDFACERWGGAVKRIVRFASRWGNQETDRLSALQRTGLDSLSLAFDQAGTHLVLLTTNFAQHELEAQAFEAYLIEDGLDKIRTQRRQAGQTNQPARERYRREAATLIQVGDTLTAVAFDQTGFDLQIVPAKNPLLADPNGELTFRVRFQGRKLAGALVRHWRIDAVGKAVAQAKKTDRQGRVSFRLSPGEQMVSVVHMISHPLPAEAAWQSIWGNLTFCLR